MENCRLIGLLNSQININFLKNLVLQKSPFKRTTKQDIITTLKHTVARLMNRLLIISWILREETSSSTLTKHCMSHLRSF